MKKEMNLNGVWQWFADIHHETKNINDVQKFHEERWEDFEIPAAWETKNVSKLFEGPVWFRKKLTLHPKWGEKMTLRFSGVSYHCTLFVNGDQVGEHEGQWDTFEMDITKWAREGLNEIILEVYKQGYFEESKFHLRKTLAGFIPDVGTTFGGIWKDVSLVISDEPRIADTRVLPNSDENKAEIFLRFDEKTCCPLEVLAELEAPDGNRTEYRFHVGEGVHEVCFLLEVEKPALWDLNDPNLYKMNLTLQNDGRVLDNVYQRFGWRTLSVNGDKILLNGRPIYIRGILHWGFYDELLCPNPDRDTIRDEIRKIKKLGFNMVKHCLYIPNQDYRDIADEEGVLIWQELPIWQPIVDEAFSERVFSQYKRIIEQMGNHPSLIMYTLGCELDASIEGELLKQLYDLVKEKAPGTLVRDNSGSGECYGGLLYDFADFYDYHFYTDPHYMPELQGSFTAGWREKRPWLFGEFCDFDTFRDVGELIQRKGERPWWLEEDAHVCPLHALHDGKMDIIHQQQRMKEEGTASQSQSLVELSYATGMVHRKTTIEEVRKDPNISGYVITSIRDVPIASSGVLDDFLEIKYPPDAFRSFNSDCTLMLQWDLSRHWKNGGDRLVYKDSYNDYSGQALRIYLIVSNYLKDLEGCTVEWALENDQGERIQGESLKIDRRIPSGTVEKIATLQCDLPEVDSTTMLTLSAAVDGVARNRWNLWVYPKPEKRKVYFHGDAELLSGFKDFFQAAEQDEGVILSTRLDAQVLQWVKDGARVLYIQRGKGDLEVMENPFWRECVKSFEAHPIVEKLCPLNYTDLQFYSLATDTSFIPDSAASRIGEFKSYIPIMRRLDTRTFKTADYICQYEIGKGILMCTTLRLEGGEGSQATDFSYHVAGQVFLDGMLGYLENT